MAKPTLESLLKKQSELAARIQRFKTSDAAQKRKNENRQKILAGAYLLNQHQQAGTFAELLKALDGFLTRPTDRAVFGLPDKALD